MTITRMSLAHILQKEFKNPLVRKKCRESSQKFLDSDDSGMSTRVFNDFPRLLPINEFNDLLQKFVDLFKEIKSIYQGADSIHLTDKKDIKALNDWGKEIATLGCAAILNGYGQLQWSFLKTLGWDEHAHSYRSDHIINILSSYIATIIEQIMSSLSESIMTHPITYTAVCKYINEQYRNWAVKAIENQEQDFSRSQAIKFATWLIKRDDGFKPQDLIVLQRLLKAEFMWDTDSILMRNEKLGFWLEVLFQTSVNKKPKLFFAMWDIFTNIFDPKQDDNYLETYQIEQYYLCQTRISLLEKEKKQLKYRPRSAYAEQKEDLSQAMMEELRERVALRTQNHLTQEDQGATTTFLLRKLNESDLEFAYGIEQRLEKKHHVKEEKKPAEAKEPVIDLKEEENSDDAAGLFQYTVGLLSAGAMGLFLLAKTSLISEEKDENRAPDGLSSIELTSHLDIRPGLNINN